MFYAFNGSSQHTVLLMYYFVYRGTESLGIWTGRGRWGKGKKKIQDRHTKSKPLKLRLMALLRTASNKDVNNEEECYGRDFNVNIVSDYAQ